MAAAVEARFAGMETVLQPGGRGDFIVTYGSTILWNKRAQDDQFPDESDILRRLESLLGD